MLGKGTLFFRITTSNEIKKCVKVSRHSMMLNKKDS